MRGFIEELRQRNVVRVGVAYVIAGWLIAQVADLASDAFNAPEWFMQMLIILLLIGLPVALFLAWAYELTPGGVVRAEDVPDDAPKDPRAGKRLNAVIIVTLVIAVAWLGWDKLHDRPAATGAAVADKSIAVLPFADFSPNGDQAWFADGLTDEILNALARTRDLRVAPRSSSFQFRGDALDIREVAAALHVAHVLEGSVRRAGDRVRVTAQLIRAADGLHLWSQSFDASSDDSIAIQEEIAFEIASVLDTAMDPDELRRMVTAGTDSIAAWEAYIRMADKVEHTFDVFDPHYGAAEILALYQEIVSLDETFAEAHYLFAQTAFDWLDPSNILLPPEGLSTAETRALFDVAAELAATHSRTEQARLGAESLRARVQVRLNDLVQITGRLVEYSPEDRSAWTNHAEALLYASRFDELRELAQRAAHNDFSNDLNTSVLFAYLSRGDLEAGLASAEEALGGASPTDADLYQSHRLYLHAGRIEEAAELARRFFASASNQTWSLLVRLRQACAEGRVADADALYAETEFQEVTALRTNIQWLALKTLGRDSEAEDIIRDLDTEETLYALAGFLAYRHFDPRPFPTLSAVLAAQGVMREDIRPMSFACQRN